MNTFALVLKRIGLLLSAGLLHLVGPMAHADPGQFDQLALPPIPDADAIVDVHGGDLDGDGFADLYVTCAHLTVGSEGQQVGVRDWIVWGGQQGPSLASVALDAATPRSGVAASFSDVDRDGDLDIVVAGGALYLGGGNMRTEPSVIYANLGARQFSNAIPLGSTHRSAGLAVFDWNNDGADDVLLSHTDGTVSVFRNFSSPGSFAFEMVQSLTVGGLDAMHATVAPAELTGDGLLDLVVLRSQSVTPNPPAGVAYFRNTGNGSPFVHALNYALPLGTPADLAVADFNADGVDDVVLAAAMPVSNSNPPPDELQQSATRILLTPPGALSHVIEDPMRFPPRQDLRVRAEDLNGDGQPDLMLTHDPCPPYQWLRSDCPEPDYAAISIWLTTNGQLVSNRQFLGAELGASRVGAVSDLTGDGLADLVVFGPPREASSGTTPATPTPLGASARGLFLPNVPPAQTWLMCLVQFLGFGIGYGGDAPWAAPAGSITTSVLDLGAYSRVRDELMPASDAGPRLHARYDAFSNEVIDLAIAHPELAAAAASTLAQWSQPVRALLNGDGQAYTVSQEMIDVVDTTLALMTQHGSVALQDVIAEERSRLPPLQSLVGLDMDAFLAATLPNSRLFGDGFED